MRIGFIPVYHPDYMDETATGIARSAAQVLRSRGIDLVEADTPVSDYKSAGQAGIQMASLNADGVILFLATWIECPTAMSALREIEHLPLCLWGFPMFQRQESFVSTGSFVSYTMFKGSLSRLGYRCVNIMGASDDDGTISQVLSFCKAARAVRAMMRTRIGLVGSTSMGIYTGTFDHVLMRGLIGPEIIYYDSYTLINRAESLAADMFSGKLARLNEQKLHNDVRPEDLEKAARFTQALHDICAEDGLCGINIKCQYEFSKEYGFVMCVPLSLLAEYGVTASCEGDILCSVSMEILHLLSGQVVAYGDSLNLSGDVLTLSPCGFMPFSMSAEGVGCIRKFMPHPGFSGIQCSFVPPPGPITMIRITEGVGSYDLICFTGMGLETGLRQGYMPALDVRLDGEGADFLRQANGQHYAFCYGDLSQELEYYTMLMGCF